MIGTNAAGTVAVGTASYDFVINGGAASNTIGGTSAGSRDVVSGNATYRVYLSDPGTSSNVVEGDYIGTNAAGNATLGIGTYGVYIGKGATANLIGGATATTADVIAGNSDGVDISGQGTESNLVDGDEIGVNAAETAALSNYDGVVLSGGASNNVVEFAVISGNYNGVVVTDAGTTGNLVECNDIGTNAAGINLGNFVDGVILEGALAKHDRSRHHRQQRGVRYRNPGWRHRLDRQCCVLQQPRWKHQL